LSLIVIINVVGVFETEI